jgi:hypothetical protein
MALKKAKASSEIAYQWTPKGNEQCSRCKMFRPPDECTAVAGDISPQGWCKIFERTGK